jgi:hypothetical protein
MSAPTTYTWLDGLMLGPQGAQGTQGVAGPQGPQGAQGGIPADYGSGLDGPLVVATGTTTTPTREMYYSSIEIQGTGKLDCRHAIYCNGTVDVSGVTGDGGIIADGNAGAAGGSSSPSTGNADTIGGAGGAARPDGTVGGGAAGGAGANGSASGFDVGATGGSGTAASRGLGGAGGAGSKGGSGTGVPVTLVGAAGTVNTGLVLQSVLSAFGTVFFGQLNTNVNKGGGGGAGGNSGSGCGGANGYAGGAGGGGGGGAGTLLGRWRNLKTGEGTPAGAIRARGGAGGNGGSCTGVPPLDNQMGGGAGGAGGGGGYVNLDIGEREGPEIIDLVIADGGATGAGGDGFIGLTPAAGPAGGSRSVAGQSGQICVLLRSTGESFSAPRATAGAAILAGTLGVGAPSGAGGVARVTL